MGKIVCTGLGPGSPDLMSVRADRLIRAARHVAYFRKAGRPGHARRIVEGMLSPEAAEYPMEYPVTTELPFVGHDYNDRLAAFYDDWAARLCDLAIRDDIVVLCEGDPFFYGSFMHLYVRLQGRVAMEVVPGINGMNGCWNVTGVPVTWGDDVLAVLMGTLEEDQLVAKMQVADALVVMKIGRNLAKVRRALESAGRLTDAWLVECATMPDQRVVRLTEASATEAPYFATVIVPGHGRAPRVRS